MRTTINAWMSSDFSGIPPLAVELAALERLKKKTYNLGITLAPSFFIRFSSFLQVRKITIKSWTCSNLCPVHPLIAELAALEHLKKFP